MDNKEPRNLDLFMSNYIKIKIKNPDIEFTQVKKELSSMSVMTEIRSQFQNKNDESIFWDNLQKLFIEAKYLLKNKPSD